MINLLMDWWIRDADVKGIETICAYAANAAQLADIRKVIGPRLSGMNSAGQRARTRLLIAACNCVVRSPRSH